MRRNSRFALIAATALVATIGLAGCSGGDSKSVAEACTSVNSAVQAANKDQTEAMLDAMKSGGDKIVDVLKQAASDLKKAADGAGNSEVKAAVYKVAEQTEKSAPKFAGMPTDVTSPEYTEWAKGLEGESTKLTEAAADLEKLCGSGS